MKITDEFINKLFENTNFGTVINGCVQAKRDQLAKNLRDQVNGYWSGSTAYHLMVNGGFLKDGKSSTYKELTALGAEFMKDYQ